MHSESLHEVIRERRRAHPLLDSAHQVRWLEVRAQRLAIGVEVREEGGVGGQEARGEIPYPTAPKNKKLLRNQSGDRGAPWAKCHIVSFYQKANHNLKILGQDTSQKLKSIIPFALQSNLLFLVKTDHLSNLTAIFTNI